MQHPCWPILRTRVNSALILVNGSRIRLYGADNAERLRGLGFDGVIADEFADWRSGVWSEVLRPALADRQGFADLHRHAKRQE